MMSNNEIAAQPILAVVVAAFNRPASLDRLLRSLIQATRRVETCPPLIVSIDGGSTEREACLAVVRASDWPGERRIIEHDRGLGLRDHIFACGDLTRQYESILVLEDDICVSPTSLRFANAALHEYENVAEIAGISLYSFIYNEFAKSPFLPVDDGCDTYFAQTASSWGQVWTRAQWAAFRDWLAREKSEADIPVPEEVLSWPKTSSWKRAYNLYLADVGRYFVFSRFSFSTNMGEKGTHLPFRSSHLTSPLSVGRRVVSFGSLGSSSARYDSFLEIEPDALKAMVPRLRDYDFDVDLTGAKSLTWLKKPFTLTARQSPYPSILSFGFRHFPPELNIVFDEPGDVFGLRKRDGLSAFVGQGLIDQSKNFFFPMAAENKTERASKLKRMMELFKGRNGSFR